MQIQLKKVKFNFTMYFTIIASLIIFLGYCDSAVHLPSLINNQYSRLLILLFLIYIFQSSKKLIPLSSFFYTLIMLTFDLVISIISFTNTSYINNILSSCFIGLSKRIVLFYLPFLLFSGLFNQTKSSNNFLKNRFEEIYIKICLIFCIQIIIYTFLQLFKIDIPGIPFEYGISQQQLTLIGAVEDNFHLNIRLRPFILFSEANYLALFLLPSFFLSIKNFIENKFKIFIIFLSILLTGSISVLLGLVTGILFLLYKNQKKLFIVSSSFLIVIIPSFYKFITGDLKGNNFFINYLFFRFGNRSGSIANKLEAIDWSFNNIGDFGLGVVDFKSINNYFVDSDILINISGSFASLYIQYGKFFLVPVFVTVIYTFYNLYKNRHSLNQWIYSAIVISLINSSWVLGSFHKTSLALFLSFLITNPLKNKCK